MNKQAMSLEDHAPHSGLAPQRRQRFAMQFSIDVCGFDRCGRFFTERSETCDVSDAGCKFYLRTELERDAVVALRLIDRYDHRANALSPMLFQIAHAERDSSGWIIGALKLHSEDAWPVQQAAAHDVPPSFD